MKRFIDIEKDDVVLIKIEIGDRAELTTYFTVDSIDKIENEMIVLHGHCKHEYENNRIDTIAIPSAVFERDRFSYESETIPNKKFTIVTTGLNDNLYSKYRKI